MPLSLAFLLAVTTALPATTARLESAAHRFGADGPTIQMGLTAPVARLGDLPSFRGRLAKNLVWTLDGEAAAETTSIRFTAVRVERGRVTASYQSDPARVPAGLSRVVEAIGEASFASFPDVCLDAADRDARTLAQARRSVRAHPAPGRRLGPERGVDPRSGLRR